MAKIDDSVKKKIPELRFEGFTDAWEERKLGDEVKINGRIGFRGYTQADIVTKETGVLAYSPTNIVNNRLYRKQSDTYITKQKYRESPEIMVKNSDILFVKTGSTLGKSALVQGINYHATVNPQIVIIRSNELDEYFLSVILTSYNILKRINTIKIGGAIPTMTETELKKFPIQVPKSTEQKKIGSFFKQLDNTIALLQRKLEQLQQTKKAFLQKMFPKEGETISAVRFKGFTDDWEERKLVSMTNYKNGKGHEDKQSTIGKFELINLNSISISGGLKHSGKFIDEADDTLQKDDLVMILSDVGHGDLLGRVALIPEDDRFVLNQRVALLRPNATADPQFLFSYINAHQYYFKAQGTGMSQLNISKGSVENFISFVPIIEEQKKIGTFFKQLDNTITLLQRELKLLKQTKQGFLQKMFPKGE